MNNLNVMISQTDYSRIMGKRIRYYAEKYDPHTILIDRQPVSAINEGRNTERKKRKSRIQTIFLSII